MCVSYLASRFQTPVVLYYELIELRERIIFIARSADTSIGGFLKETWKQRSGNDTGGLSLLKLCSLFADTYVI